MRARRPGEAQGPPSIAAELTRLKGETLNHACTNPDLTDGDFRTLYAAFDQIHRLPGPQFLLLWPSLPTLAEASRSSVTSVRASLKRLVRAGYLMPVRRGGGRAADGRGIPNSYRAIFGGVFTEGGGATVPFDASYPTNNGASTPPRTAHNPLDNPLKEPLEVSSAANAAPTQSQNLLPGKNRVVGQPSAPQLARIQKLRGMLVQHERNQDSASAASCRKQIDALLADLSE